MRNAFYLLIFIIISFVGCSGTLKGDNNSPLSQQDQPSVVRFDKELYEYLLAPDSLKEAALKKNHIVLLLALERITVDNNDDENVIRLLKEYFSNPSLMQLYRDELSTFSDFTPYAKELETAQKNVKQYFPEKQLPLLCLHVSGYRENAIILHNMISVSADKYLGSEYSGYKSYFRPYERQQMQPQYLVRDYLKAWLISDNVIETTHKGKNLIMAMVDEGKLLYTLMQLLPEKDEDEIIGYTAVQSAWCKSNEKSIWQSIVKSNHLYDTDHMLITRYVNDAPNTAPISPDSPGRLGAWIGLQMIERYVSKTGATLDKVLNTDSQTILKESKYNP